MLMCKNATTYNENDSDVHQCALRVLSNGVATIKQWRENRMYVGVLCVAIDACPSVKVASKKKSESSTPEEKQ